MRTNKVYIFFNSLFISTPFLYIIFLIIRSRLENAIWFKTYGTTEGNIGDCTGISYTIIPIMLLLYGIFGLLFVYILKRQVTNDINKKWTFFQKAQMTFVSILTAPLILVDLFIIFGIANLLIEYMTI